MMKRLLALGAMATMCGALSTQASPDLVTAEDMGRYAAVSSVSMSIEGDMLVGVISDPTDPKSELSAAYWDLSGEIDTSKPLIPNNVTPSAGRTLFRSASALKAKKSFWGTVQPYKGALQGCGEGKTTGSTKKYLTKAYFGNEKLKKITDIPAGRKEIGANKMMERCLELVGNTSIVRSLPLHPTDVIIARQSTKDGTRYYRHNLENGKEKFLLKASDTETTILNNTDGSKVASSKLEFDNGEWTQYISLKNPKTGKIEQEDPLTIEIKDRYTMDVAGLHTDDKFFVLTDKFDDKVSVYMYDSVANTFSKDPVFAHPEFNVSSVVFSDRPKDFGEVIGFRYQGPVIKSYWLDPEFDSIQKGLDASFKDKNVTILDYSPTMERVLFRVQSMSMPPTYFLLVDKSKVAIIGSERPWMTKKKIGWEEFDYYTARDGLKIPALIAYPEGFKKGKDKARGAIIHPHGGPWARDYGNFDFSGWTQYFTSRGYIVLRPQYRGSDGWGRKLWLAGDGEWGGKMQDDKDDAASWLVKNGHVDADKIAIHGYSYGGFAAIAASVRPNSPYACAIGGAGVANLTRIANEWGSNRIQRIFQGNTVDGMDPQQNVDKVNIPIQLYHGDYDVRVPLWHSVDFYNAIKEKSPQSELIVHKQMGHQGNKWLPKHKAAVLEDMERFLTTTCNM